MLGINAQTHREKIYTEKTPNAVSWFRPHLETSLELIGRLAESGKAIIYASCEFAEILGITDRIYVLYDGRIRKEVETARATEEELLFYATGGK